MTSFRRRVLIKAFKLFDLGVMALSFGLAAIPVSHGTPAVSFASFLSIRVKMQNIVLFVGLLLAWHAIFSMLGLYESRRMGDRKNEVKDILRATFWGTLLVASAALLFRIRLVTPAFLVAFWVASCSLTVSSRLGMRIVLKFLRSHGRNLRHMLIVGTNPRAVQFARAVESRPELGYRLIGFVDDPWAGSEEFRWTGYSIVADFQHVQNFLRERIVDEVVLALPMRSSYSQASQIVALCKKQGILVRFLSDVFNPQLAQSNVDELGEDAAIMVYRYPLEGWPIVMKRALDVLLSLLLLLLLAPFSLIIVVLIKLDSKGPVFFGQERVGLNKRKFRMCKFRTMIADAERGQAALEKRNEVAGPVFKIKDDPRVTRIGKLLRRTSVDELPQLFNVLKGEMSLVGPRPLPVRDYEGFDQDWQRRRFSVRPGITCLWQINGRSSVSFDHWMDLDMQYIDHWSLWLDLKILAKTIPAVLKGTGAA